MINTLIIVMATIINTIWGFYWIRESIIQHKERDTRKKHIELCLRCVEIGSCPHNCKVCAWGDVMTERQLNHKIELSPAEEKYYSDDVNEIMREIQLDQENREKRAKEFYKEIKEYHRRHKHER